MILAARAMPWTPSVRYVGAVKRRLRAAGTLWSTHPVG
jgi:hypothetical protein